MGLKQIWPSNAKKSHIWKLNHLSASFEQRGVLHQNYESFEPKKIMMLLGSQVHYTKRCMVFVVTSKTVVDFI